MAGKNVSAQDAKDKALGERIKMVREIQRRILDPIMILVQLVRQYDYDAPPRADLQVADIVDLLRLLVIGGHMELISQGTGDGGGHFVPSDYLEVIIESWMADIKEAKGGEA